MAVEVRCSFCESLSRLFLVVDCGSATNVLTDVWNAPPATLMRVLVLSGRRACTPHFLKRATKQAFPLFPWLVGRVASATNLDFGRCCIFFQLGLSLGERMGGVLTPLICDKLATD